MTRIFIRCDASLMIGSGHVMRCLTLARELQRRGAEVIFLCRRQLGDLINLLEQEFAVLALPEQSLADCDGLDGRDLYSSWLGCTQEQDAAQCLEVLSEAEINGATWIVADHYGLDARWESQLLAGLAGGDAPPQLLVIDDLADRSHQADCLLDQNFFGSSADDRYESLVPRHCRQLLGPHYALLAPEYAYLHSHSPIRTELKRLLIYFGGVDMPNVTAMALEALLDPALADLAVDVVLGLQSPHRQLVEEMVSTRPLTTLHDPLPSLAGLILRADLAVGAGGITTWERSCLGLPSIVVVTANNQLSITQELEQAGFIKCLGDIDNVSVESIRQFLIDLRQQSLPSFSSQGIADGWGASRVATALLGIDFPLQLRLVRSSDEKLLLDWANDNQVRSQSFSSKKITVAEHHSWFSSGLKNSDRLHLLALDKVGCPLGQIRFDRFLSGLADQSRQANVGISLDRCSRGFGLGTKMLLQGLDALQKLWGTSTEVVAQVFDTNKSSQAIFVRAGFVKSTSAIDSSSSSRVTQFQWRSPKSD